MENNVEYVLTQWVLSRKEFAIIGGWNSYKLHKIVSDVFNESCQFEVNSKSENIIILIKSKGLVKEHINIGKFSSKTVKIPLIAGNNYRIKVKLNATKQSDGRIPLVGYNQIREWVFRKSEDIGMRIDLVKVGSTQTDYSTKNNMKISCTWHDVEIIGTITSTDNMKKTIECGLGKQRKFGYGFVKFFQVV